MSRSKYENIQSDLMAFIPEACFFLSLLSVAEDMITDFGIVRESPDLIDAYRKARTEGWLGKDNIMYNDVALLSYLTGKKVTKKVLMPNPVLDVAKNEYTIAKYAKGSATHFRRRGYDVYANSKTVAKGQLVAIYMYKLEV